MKNFVSVNTGAARFQDLSLNPQKLAGQCAKLKCCLNYEVDQYLEASKALPGRDVSLQTTDGEYFLFKSDILTGMVTYSTDKRMAANLVTIPASRAKEVIELNRNGEKPDQLLEGTNHEHKHKPIDLATQEDVSRFDKKKKKKKKKANAEAAADKPEPNIQESAQEPTAADKPKARKNGNRNKQGKPRKPKPSADVPPQE